MNVVNWRLWPQIHPIPVRAPSSNVTSPPFPASGVHLLPHRLIQTNVLTCFDQQNAKEVSHATSEVGKRPEEALQLLLFPWGYHTRKHSSLLEHERPCGGEWGTTRPGQHCTDCQMCEWRGLSPSCPLPQTSSWMYLRWAKGSQKRILSGNPENPDKQ